MGFRTVKAGRVAAVLAALMAALGGCNGGSITPPPTPGLNAISVPESAVEEARLVVMIAAPKPTDEGREWEQAARTDAGRARVVFSATRPEPNDPPAKQADLIREALGHGAVALLVDPVDDPEVVAALNEAREKGTAVVLLDPRIHDRDPARPLPRVSFVPLDEPARVLVEAALADLRKLGLPAGGHALIVLKIGSGPRATETAEGLTKALTSAGFTGVEVVSVVDNFQDAARPLVERLSADPKVTTLLGVGDTQVRAAMTARDELKKTAKRPFSVGGIVTLSRPMQTSGFTRCFGVLDRNQPELARRALRSALGMARGEPAPDGIQLPIVFHEGVASPLDDEHLPGPRPRDVGAAKQ